MDVETAERVEAELDSFILKRAREREDENRIEALWAESTRRHNRRIREENRQAWLDFHRHLQCLHEDLARQHEEKASLLLEVPANGCGGNGTARTSEDKEIA